MMNEPRMKFSDLYGTPLPIVGYGQCSTENCPSQEHDVEQVFDDEGEFLHTVFTCRVCDLTEAWIPDGPRGTEEKMPQ